MTMHMQQHFNTHLKARGQHTHAILHDVLLGHEERVHVLESVELCLVDATDDASVVRRQLDRLVSELRREVGQVLVTLQSEKKTGN